MGYDRAFLIGDMNISGSYELTTEFVLHGYDSEGWAFGAASGWLGHTLDNYGDPDPSQPFIGHPFPAWGVIGTDFSGTNSFMIYENFVPLYETILSENTVSAVALETIYSYHYRVTANPDGLTNHNSLNVWPKGTPEPTQWMAEADTPMQAVSILFDAHNVDVSIGPTITFARPHGPRTKRPR
jgi:hypothetical protein